MAITGLSTACEKVIVFVPAAVPPKICRMPSACAGVFETVPPLKVLVGVYDG